MMGGGSWTTEAFDSVSSGRASKPREHTFTSKAVHETMNPVNIVLRESRDSVDHPLSNAIIVAFDETGSMGEIPAYFANTALGTLMKELLAKRPVTDPQLMVCGVGDSTGDRSPFQPGQFESDVRIDEWLTKIHLEGNGQGGGCESYGLVHHFAGTKTSIDCFEKRGVKGLLFTIGDEMPHPVMYAREIQKVFGDAEAKDITIEQAIAEASRLYDVFHIVVRSRSYDPSMSLGTWQKLLPERVLVLEDYTALPEMIMTAIGRARGMSMSAATAGFSPKTTEMILRSGVTSIVPTSASDIVQL